MDLNDFWKSKAEKLLKRAFDDYRERYGKVYFAGENHVVFILPRPFVEEIQAVLERRKTT